MLAHLLVIPPMCSSQKKKKLRDIDPGLVLYIHMDRHPSGRLCGQIMYLCIRI